MRIQIDATDMKVEVDQRLITTTGPATLWEVFNGILLETPDGHQMGLCMRDGTFEINILPHGKEACWYRMETRQIRLLNERQGEVFNGILLETPDGHQMGLCMRDGTFEINVLPHGKEACWYRIDMETRQIRLLNEGQAETAKQTAEEWLLRNVPDDPDELRDPRGVRACCRSYGNMRAEEAITEAHELIRKRADVLGLCVGQMTEIELDAILRANGEDPEKVVAQVRAIIDKAIESMGQQDVTCVKKELEAK